MRRLSPHALEEELADGAAGTRAELSVEQIAPYAQPGYAFLPIAKGHEAEVRARVASLAEPLGHVLAVAETDEALLREPEFFSSLAPGVTALRVGHDSDRTYAGYGPLVGELRALAPHLQNARFTIADMDWIDDVRLSNGALSIVRWRGTEDMDSDADVLEAMAGEDDDELRVHALVECLRTAESLTSEAFYATGAARQDRGREARKWLARASRLPAAAAQNALLELVLGADEEGERIALQALTTSDLPLAHFVAALVALEEDRESDMRSHADAATRRASWMAEAHLLALGGGEDRAHSSSLMTLAQNHANAYPGHTGGPWNRLRLPLLVRATNAEQLDARLLAISNSELDAPQGVALLLFTYGEALRLANAHARARTFFEQALRHDSLAGEIETRMAWLKDR